MKRFLLSLAGIVLLGFSFISFVYATPSVIWSPQKITEEVLINETREVTVQLNFMAGAQKVNIGVVPELSGVLSVNPNYIASVNAGETVPITLMFNIGSNTPEGTLDGVIQAKVGNRTLAKPLPIVLNIIARPLRDIDNDGDGVWDDIQAFIDGKYSDQPELRNGFRQYIMATQLAVLNAADQTASLDAATKIQRAIECLYWLKGEESDTPTDEITAAFLNSDQRTRAYLMFNDQLGGQVFPSTPDSELSSTCQ